MASGTARGFSKPTGRLDPKNWDRTLFEALLDASDGDDGGPAIEDQDRQPLTRKRLITASFVLGRRLARISRPGEHVGILLPNANAVAAAAFALLAYGRVPAMMNFTAGVQNLLAAGEIVGIRTVLTSRRFAEMARLEETIAALRERCDVLYLEDVRQNLGLADKLIGAAMARAPHYFHRRMGVRPGDVAVVLFTSGTEQRPKAVALSHANILANIEQVVQSIAFTPDDLMFNALPVFHSFGLTAGLFLPLLAGFRTFLYPSPLHYNEIPALVKDLKATIVVAIDTFAAGWARNAAGDEFRSVRLMVLGAERVKDTTRQTWKERFGTEILEGYGVTEASPVLSVNLPGRNRPGTVGPLLPGIEWRLQPVPGITVGQKLFVRGPNVMAGYYSPEEHGRLLPPPDGWHDTGDIVSIDGEGFVTIQSRAKRFAKVAGEMVSLVGVEGYVALARPEAAHAVVSLPDTRKGEIVVLVTTATDLGRTDLLPVARQQGFADITVPDRVITVEELPLLGTGKVDYVSVEALAAKWLADRAAGKAEPQMAASSPSAGGAMG